MHLPTLIKGASVRRREGAQLLVSRSRARLKNAIAVELCVFGGCSGHLRSAKLSAVFSWVTVRAVVEELHQLSSAHFVQDNQRGRADL